MRQCRCASTETAFEGRTWRRWAKAYAVSGPMIMPPATTYIGRDGEPPAGRDGRRFYSLRSFLYQKLENQRLEQAASASRLIGASGPRLSCHRTALLVVLSKGFHAGLV